MLNFLFPALKHLFLNFGKTLGLFCARTKRIAVLHQVLKDLSLQHANTTYHKYFRMPDRRHEVMQCCTSKNSNRHI